ncbi:MAG: VOC family protein [Thermomicrobiales bacterium]|nr:VOC family protein [Thermomicrobiales bacterium]
MPKRLDHLVIAVHDLDRASADFAAAGFVVTPGGEHTGGATHNALVSFVDGAYFELIAIKDPEKARTHRWFDALNRDDGAIDFALDAPGLDATSQQLAATGLAVDGPRRGGRLRPDGRQVDWQMLQPASDPPAPLPFLIEDLTPRELRVPGGAATHHPLGPVRVAGLTIVVGDLAAASRAFTALLGPADGNRFAIGSQWLELVPAGDPGSVTGQLHQARGDGIFRIDLAGAGPGTSQTLPAELTHGVEIRVNE